MGRGVEYLPACFVFFSFQGGGGGNTDGGHGQRNQRSRFESGWRRRQGRRRRLPPSLLSTKPRCVSAAPEEQLNCCKREGPGQGMNPNYHSTFRAVLTLTSPFKLAGIPAECFWKKRGGVLRSCFPPRGPSRRAFPDAVTPQ